MGNSRKDTIREQVDRLGIPPKEMVKKEIVRHERKDSYKKLARGILIGLALAVAAVIIITNLWVTMLTVEGTSMNPLLQPDEIVIVVRTNNPAKNDVIAFYHNSKIYIKRVIAEGGDMVNIREDGTVSVNGKMLDEPYVTELSLGNSCDIEFPFQVPSGTVFVLGDNRPSALDSRSSRIGTIGKDEIIGRVTYRIWPLSKLGSFS